MHKASSSSEIQIRSQNRWSSEVCLCYYLSFYLFLLFWFLPVSYFKIPHLPFCASTVFYSNSLQTFAGWSSLLTWLPICEEKIYFKCTTAICNWKWHGGGGVEKAFANFKMLFLLEELLLVCLFSDHLNIYLSLQETGTPDAGTTAQVKWRKENSRWDWHTQAFKEKFNVSITN